MQSKLVNLRKKLNNKHKELNISDDVNLSDIDNKDNSNYSDQSNKIDKSKILLKQDIYNIENNSKVKSKDINKKLSNSLDTQSQNLINKKKIIERNIDMNKKDSFNSFFNDSEKENGNN